MTPVGAVGRSLLDLVAHWRVRIVMGMILAGFLLHIAWHGVPDSLWEWIDMGIFVVCIVVLIAGQRRSEASASQSAMEVLVAALPTATIVINAAGRVVASSERAAAILGAEPDLLRGMLWRRIAQPVPSLGTSRRGAADASPAVVAEGVVYTVSGVSRPMRWTTTDLPNGVRMVHFEAPDPAGSAATWPTEALDAVPDGVLIFADDAQHALLAINTRARRMLGVSAGAESPVGQPMAALLPDDVKPVVLTKLRGPRHANDIPIRTAVRAFSGACVDAEVVAQRARLGDAHVVVWTLRDVGAQSAADRVLRLSEIEQRTLLEAIETAVLLVNLDGTPRISNQRRVDLGCEADELASGEFHDHRWVLRDEAGDVLGFEGYPIRQTLRDHAPRRTVVGFQAPDRSLRWLSISTQPVRDPATQEVTAVAAAFTDVTALREATESRAQLMRELEWSLSLKDAFLTQIGHEFRNSLNVVLGMLLLMEEPALAPGETPALEGEPAGDASAAGRHAIEVDAVPAAESVPYRPRLVPRSEIETTGPSPVPAFAPDPRWFRTMKAGVQRMRAVAEEMGVLTQYARMLTDTQEVSTFDVGDLLHDVLEQHQALIASVSATVAVDGPSEPCLVTVSRPILFNLLNALVRDALLGNLNGPVRVTWGIGGPGTPYIRVDSQRGWRAGWLVAKESATRTGWLPLDQIATAAGVVYGLTVRGVDGWAANLLLPAPQQRPLRKFA